MVVAFGFPLLETMDWNDLRYAVTVARRGSLSGAARELRSSPQTVGRRVAALEYALGVALFVRHAGGYRVTADGEVLLSEGASVDAAVRALQARAASLGGEVAGLVRVAAPETIVTRLLLPALKPLLDCHPRLQLEIASGVPLVGIARGEADIALRLVRPLQGALTVRDVGAMAQGLYAAPGTVPDASTRRVIGWPPELDLAAPRWLREHIGREPDIRLLHLAEHAIAIRSGLGIGILPCFLAEGLIRLPSPGLKPERLWLVAQHSDAQPERIRVVYDEIARIVTAAAPSFDPVL
jgi:DNA-binding transcriptional LysR family regulator